MLGCTHSGDHVVRVVVLRAAVSTMRFEMVSFSFNVYCSGIVTNIVVLGLTISDVVVLSAAATISFHFCGEMWANLGRTYAGPVSMWVVGNEIKNRRRTQQQQKN